MTTIRIVRERFHAKASEKYVDVEFIYSSGNRLDTAIPVIYRRTGTEIEDAELMPYLEEVGEKIEPSEWATWREQQEEFWASKPKASTTKSFFDVLSERFEWCCVNCNLPSNRNFARRIQDLKEFGYTIATDTGRFCPKCSEKTTHLIMVPLPRGGITGYETWSASLRARIISTLENFDSYEGRKIRPEGLLPDHKFPEIRWDSQTKRESLESLNDEEIKRDFQLLSNQRNQQKREVCRTCFQTGARGVIYGIDFFYEGIRTWEPSIPPIGKAAERGCIGCGWYDIDRWRTELLLRLGSSGKEV